MKEKLFRQILVWKKIDEDKVCCYRVFQNLSSQKYFCKGMDYFKYPLDKKIFRTHEYYGVDSLFQDGLKFEKTFKSIKKAIKSFEKDFE